MGPQALQALPAEGLQEQKAGRARATALDAEALVWVLCALSQGFRIRFLCNIPRPTPFFRYFNELRGRATILFIAHKLPPSIEAVETIGLKTEVGK